MPYGRPIRERFGWATRRHPTSSTRCFGKSRIVRDRYAAPAEAVPTETSAAGQTTTATSGGSQPRTAVTLEMVDSAFNPNLKNLGISVNVNRGQAKSVTRNAPPGDYYFCCGVDSHEQAGTCGTRNIVQQKAVKDRGSCPLPSSLSAKSTMQNSRERGTPSQRQRSIPPPNPDDSAHDQPGWENLEGEWDSVPKRLTWRGEFLLALLPTLTVLFVLGLVEEVTRQRLLFASLTSSTFQIYLDPRHPANNARTIVSAQFLASVFGLGAALVFGHNYGGAAAALATTVVVMILIDTVHPPAVPTSLAFSLRSAPESNFALFALAVAIIAWLVVLERASLWLLNRLDGRLSRDSAAGRVRGSRSAHEPGGSPGGDAGDDGEDNTPEETPG